MFLNQLIQEANRQQILIYWRLPTRHNTKLIAWYCMPGWAQPTSYARGLGWPGQWPGLYISLALARLVLELMPMALIQEANRQQILICWRLPTRRNTKLIAWYCMPGWAQPTTWAGLAWPVARLIYQPGISQAGS